VTGTNLVVVPHRFLPESQTAVIRGDVAMAFTFFNVGGVDSVLEKAKTLQEAT